MKTRLTRTVERVEQAFWTIVFSARKQAGERGVLLPERFASKAKIERFLRKTMTPCLAKRVIGSLDLRRIRGRLAIPVGDGIGAPPIVKARVLAAAGRTATVAVWFAFDRDDRFFRVYQLRRKADGRWIVFGRHPLDYPFGRAGGRRREPSVGCCAPCVGSS